MESREKKNTLTGVVMILIAIIIVLCGGIIYDKFFKENDITKEPDKVEKKKSEEDKEIHKTGILYKNASIDEEVCKTNSKTPFTVGTKYTCDNLGDGKEYTFYVLNDATNTGKVDLIMDRDYTVSSYYNSNNVSSENIGPYYLMMSLPSKDTWTNVETPDSSVYDYSAYSARFPKASEIASACGITSFNELDAAKIYELKNRSTCSFLYTNTEYTNKSVGYLGYYTETPSTNTLAWIVDSNNMTQSEWESKYGDTTNNLYNNITLHAVDGTMKLGVRPVITLSK